MRGAAPARPFTTMSVRHALTVAGGFTALFVWLYARPLLELSYLAEADNFDFYLPNFLAPLTIWSGHEFAGTPEFANPQTTGFYPLHLLFARVVGGAVGWTAFIASGAILAASFTYAYVFAHTGSRLAATVAGLTFGASEAIMERIAHPTILHGAAWIPLVLLAIDGARQAGRRRWIAVGAFAVGCLLLSGHPQVAVYGLYLAGLYAAATAVMERPGVGFHAGVTAAFALGLLLAAVMVLPLAEATSHVARQDVSFDAFASRSNTPWEMLSALFPAIEHDGRDAPTYVGLVALLLSAAAACGVRRQWRVAFWSGVVVIGYALGAGGATPLAEYAYELPLYDRFRVVARHLIVAAFGLSVLAGLGLALIQRREIRRRALTIAVVGAIAGFGVAAWVLLGAPSAVTFREAESWLPISKAGVWQQVLVVLAGALAIAVFASRPSSRPAAAAIIVVVAFDLLQALPYGVDARGLVNSLRISEAILSPSVHANRLRSELGTQRFASIDGTGDGLVTGAFARLWKMPSAGGNSTMLLARHSELAMMQTNGAVNRLALQDDNVALDALAVRFVIVETDTLRSAGPLDLPVGPRECGQRNPRIASFHLPTDLRVAQLTVVAHLGCSEDVPQGTLAATMRLESEGRLVVERPLRAGIEIAEESLVTAARIARARHGVPDTVVARGNDRLSYEQRLTLPEPIAGGVLTIEVTGTAGWMELHRLVVTDPQGSQVSLGDRELMFSAPRWRPVTTFTTSRYSDRERDENAPDEKSYTVLENRRARPRVWLASEVLALSRKQQRLALHHSYLPDGGRLDLSRTALVDGSSVEATTFDSEGAVVLLRSADDGAVDVAVSSRGGGMLVLSETAYPGWQVRVDGKLAPIRTVNLSLLGVEVPPGDHRVRFEFVSGTLRAGAAISLTTLAVVLGLGCAPARRPRAAAAAPQSL